MVETARVPIDEIGVMHERVGWPSAAPCRRRTGPCRNRTWSFQPQGVPKHPEQWHALWHIDGAPLPIDDDCVFHVRGLQQQTSGSTRWCGVPTAGFAARASRIPSESSEAHL